MYAIRNNKFELWSNEFGWSGDDIFDLFTLEERETLSLPIGGQWIYYDIFNNKIILGQSTGG